MKIMRGVWGCINIGIKGEVGRSAESGAKFNSSCNVSLVEIWIILACKCKGLGQGQTHLG